MSVAASSASRRWQRLVRTRLATVALLDPDRDGIPPAFWDDRAERYARRVADTVAHDPLLPRIRPHVDADTVVLDVGAGTGRFSLALAGDAREVVALDPSAGMLRILTEQARAQEVSNVRTVLGRLEDLDDVSGDVLLCAHVLPVLPDARSFLARLDRIARRRVFVYLGAGNSDLRTDPLWRHFHRQARPPAPTYLDAVAVLRELGITAQVEVVEVPTSDRYATVAEAVEDHLDLLRLEDSEQVRGELTELLETWLIRRPDGMLRAPVPALPAAILSWIPAWAREPDSARP